MFGCFCLSGQELAGECGSQALNPNELGAVLKVLSLLAAELEADTAGQLSTVRGHSRIGIYLFFVVDCPSFVCLFDWL